MRQIYDRYSAGFINKARTIKNKFRDHTVNYICQVKEETKNTSQLCDEQAAGFID